MKTWDRILTAIGVIASVAVGFIIGSKYTKPEINLDFGKTKVRKRGTIVISPDISQEQPMTKRELRKERKAEKRRLKKENKK